VSSGSPASKLARALAVYAIALAAVCAAVVSAVSLRPLSGGRREIVATVWRGGQAVARAVVGSPGESAPPLDEALRQGGELVLEEIVADAPIVTGVEAVFAMSLVPARDGVRVTLDGRVAYVTPDDLLSAQAYDKGIQLGGLGVSTGVDVQLVLALLADRLHAPVPVLRERASIRRVRVERTRPSSPPPPRVTAESLTNEIVRASALDLARYLARGLNDKGRFRYLVDAPTNRALSGYDWPRHAGATYFLAQAAALSGDAALRAAALHAASVLRDQSLIACGDATCVDSGSTIEIGSSALAAIAFVEIARTGIDPSYAEPARALAGFLRAQQRADGEFMHYFDRKSRKPVDVQLLYFSGEATLALSRVHALLGDPRDLDGARRGLAHLVGPAWSFFGSRYYFGEEHWTCQAVDDLWRRAPDPAALDFCLRWHAYGRRLQHTAGDSPHDSEGAYSADPVVTPRLTPVASRCEAGIATLAAGRAAGTDPGELRALDQQLRRSLALLVRKQFRPGPSHLFADPAAVYGAMPGSEVDWQLRIDYAQHAGSAMIRWLDLSDERAR